MPKLIEQILQPNSFFFNAEQVPENEIQEDDNDLQEFETSHDNSLPAEKKDSKGELSLRSKYLQNVLLQMSL